MASASFSRMFQHPQHSSICPFHRYLITSIQVNFPASVPKMTARKTLASKSARFRSSLTPPKCRTANGVRNAAEQLANFAVSNAHQHHTRVDELTSSQAAISRSNAKICCASGAKGRAVGFRMRCNAIIVHYASAPVTCPIGC